MVAFFYIGFPFVVIWITARLLLGRIKSRTFMFFVLMTCLLYVTCTLGGLFASFFFEPESYWYSMHIDMSYWNAHAFPPGSTLAHALAVPYIGAVQFLLISFYILHTHFNWSFAAFFAGGIFTLFNWVSATVSCWRMRDPNYGF